MKPWMKFWILGIVQCLCLIAGVALVASVTPSLMSLDYWTRCGVGVIGVLVLLGGLAARDFIREMTRK